MSKTFFIDMTRCTACRGCQVACKQWKKLPATETKQTGSMQNPPELNFSTYKLVRFNEVDTPDGGVQWLFMPDQCRHCVYPPCKDVGDAYNEKAVKVDEKTGAVVYTEFTRDIDEEDPLNLCPYNIPRRDPATGIWSKCDMCIDRVQNGMLPACVLSCPTGTMNFGDRAEMLEMADKRLAVVKKKHPEAMLVDVDSVNVVFLATHPPEEYYEFLLADASTSSIARTMLANAHKRSRLTRRGLLGLG